MKHISISEKIQTATTLEEKVWEVHAAFSSIPVRISYGSWEGFEIRLTEEGNSVCYGPTYWKVNVNDVELIERLAAAFEHIDHTMLEILNKVWAYQHLGMHVGFLEELDIDEMLRRWDRFNNWVGKYYPDYNLEPLNRAFNWTKHKSIPDNAIAWAVRVILYGIKPSKIGMQLFKEHKVEVDPTGILKLTEDSELECRWHFKKREDRQKGDPSEIDSFGIGGCLSACMQRAFGDEKDIIECNKVPEQWEIDANVFIGVAPKKKSLFK